GVTGRRSNQLSYAPRLSGGGKARGAGEPGPPRASQGGGGEAGAAGAGAGGGGKKRGFHLVCLDWPPRGWGKGPEIADFRRCPRRIATKIRLFRNCAWSSDARIAYVTRQFSRVQRPTKEGSHGQGCSAYRDSQASSRRPGRRS